MHWNKKSWSAKYKPLHWILCGFAALICLAYFEFRPLLLWAIPVFAVFFAHPVISVAERIGEQAKAKEGHKSKEQKSKKVETNGQG
jgi:fatty acid desaturase